MNNTAHPCHLPNSSKVATFVLGSLMEKAGGQVFESNGSPNYCDGSPKNSRLSHAVQKNAVRVHQK